MTRLFNVALLGCLWLLVGCMAEAPPREVYINPATAIALTPTATATPAPPTPTHTPTPTPTVTPTRTPEPTASPVPTATLAPTPTSDPQLADLDYCEKSFGPVDGARFAGRLVAVESVRLDLVDQITLTFTDTEGLLHGTAICIQGAEWESLAGTSSVEAPGASVLAIELDDWAHDDAWAGSPITETVVISDIQSLSQVGFASDPLKSRGAMIGIGLRRPLPFRVRVEEGPPRIVVEVQRDARLEAREDVLAEPAGRVEVPDKPIFFIQNSDIWRLVGERAQPLATTPELETSLAISPDGDTLAVCRAAADSEPAFLPYDVRASLWVMSANGEDERLLADVGGCADLQFSPSGKTISFTANTAAAPPALLSVWTVPVVVGEPQVATPIGDEWSRFGAQWLPDSRLVYHARHDSGFSSLFIREEDGSEREVAARLLTGSRYSGVGEFVIGEDLLAIEALRADNEGADLALLRFDGAEVAVDRRGYWQRPLAFQPEGLLYLSTECPSGVVQEYTLLRRRADGAIDELLTGRTTAGLGAVTPFGDLLLLNRIAEPLPGVLGPGAEATMNSPVSLWAMTADGAARSEVYRAPVPVYDIAVARQ